MGSKRLKARHRRVFGPLRPGKGSDSIIYTTNLVIRSLARRIKALNNEIKTVDRMLAALIENTAPSLLDLHGIGVDTAASLLVTAGDNPDRPEGPATPSPLSLNRWIISLTRSSEVATSPGDHRDRVAARRRMHYTAQRHFTTDAFDFPLPRRTIRCSY